jgi:acyl-CoA thioesterase
MTPNDPAALVRRLMRRDRWAALAGARLVEVREGYARVRMRLREEHLNGVDVAQGGAIFTLADFAFAVASNSHGTVAVALDVSITFARAARTGVLTAEAVEESVSRRVSVCAVRVTDARGEVVALFRGTAFRKEEPIAALLAAPRKERAPRPAARGPVTPGRDPGRRKVRR